MLTQSYPTSRATPAAPNRVSSQCIVLDRFAFDRDQLTPAHHAQLSQLASFILARQRSGQIVAGIEIIGHTDPVGSAVYNLTLGRRRAQQAANALQADLEARQSGSTRRLRFVVESRGEAQPISRDNARNRRVEICLRAAPQPVPPRPVPTPPSPKPDISQQLRRWFTTGGVPPMQPIRPGNLVLPLVGGAATFDQMVRAIGTARGRGDFIYLAGWYLDLNFPLTRCDPNTTAGKLFADASRRGVQIRALLWDQFGTQNTAEVKSINRLANSAAILDNRTLNLGVHHQKILIVKGSEGLIAFCGGVDLNADRISPCPGNRSGHGGSSGGSGSGGGGGSPLHDVHCRITGPAAHDLLKIFVERWLDHPDHPARDRAKGRLLGTAELARPLPAAQGPMFAQIGRTYGNGSRHRGIGRGGYRFAPTGEQTIQRMVLQAIRAARRFIYLEDQYLVNLEISRALLAALPNIQHLTILIPHSSLLSSDECPQQHHRMRRAFIAPLRAAGGSKVRVFHLAPPGATNTYVHAKMWIFDDELAIIGSANVNRRGYKHDSEVAAAIFDPSPNPFAKRLRVALWAKHLNMNNPTGQASLQDGVASAGLWLAPPRGAHIAPFNENARISNSGRFYCRIASWDGQIDPDGS